MRAKVGRWGNSLALRLPHDLARDLDLAEGAELDLVSTGGRLVGTPAKPRHALKDLLATVTEPARECDWGPPVGREAW